MFRSFLPRSDPRQADGDRIYIPDPFEVENGNFPDALDAVEVDEEVVEREPRHEEEFESSENIVIELDVEPADPDAETIVYAEGMDEMPCPISVPRTRFWTTLTIFACIFALALGAGAIGTYRLLGWKASQFVAGDDFHVASTIKESSPAAPDQPLALTTPRASVSTSNREKHESNVSASTLELPDAIGDLSSFRAQLASYIESLPEDERAIHFQQVMTNDVPRLDVLLRWNRLLDAWSRLDMLGLSPSQAAKLNAAASPLVPMFPQTANGAAVRDRLALLARVASRVDDAGNSITADMVPMFESPLARVPYVLQTIAGQRFYLTAPPARSNGSMTFDYVINKRLETKQRSIASHELNVRASGRLSHAGLARESLALLQRLDDDNWESTFFRLARSILLEAHLSADESLDDQIDVFVKVHWLRAVLETGCRGSHVLSKAFEEHLEALRRAQPLLDVNWLDPDAKELSDERRQLVNLLADLPDFDSAGVAAAKELNELIAFDGQPEYEWVGVLLRDEAGQWGCVLNLPQRDAIRRLFVFDHSNDETAVRVRFLGEFNGHHCEFAIGQEAQLREGQPVLMAE